LPPLLNHVATAFPRPDLVVGLSRGPTCPLPPFASLDSVLAEGIESRPLLGFDDPLGGGIQTTQIIGHPAIYLDRSFDPPRVALNSEPVLLLSQENGSQRGLPHYLDVRFGPAGWPPIPYSAPAHRRTLAHHEVVGGGVTSSHHAAPTASFLWAFELKFAPPHMPQDWGGAGWLGCASWRMRGAPQVILNFAQLCSGQCLADPRQPLLKGRRGLPAVLDVFFFPQAEPNPTD